MSEEVGDHTQASGLSCPTHRKSSPYLKSIELKDVEPFLTANRTLCSPQDIEIGISTVFHSPLVVSSSVSTDSLPSTVMVKVVGTSVLRRRERVLSSYRASRPYSTHFFVVMLFISMGKMDSGSVATCKLGAAEYAFPASTPSEAFVDW